MNELYWFECRQGWKEDRGEDTIGREKGERKVNYETLKQWRQRGSLGQVTDERTGAVPSSMKKEVKEIGGKLGSFLFIRLFSGLDLRSPFWMPDTWQE